MSGYPLRPTSPIDLRAGRGLKTSRIGVATQVEFDDETLSRFDAIEQQIEGANSKIFATREEAINATIPGTVSVILTRGGFQIGDGLDFTYRRAASADPSGRGFQSADRAFWWRIDTVNPAFLGTGRASGWTTYRGNGPYEGSLGMLNEQPDSTQNNNFAKASQNAHSVFRGTASAPDRETSYARTASYIEHHCAVALGQAISVWGNPYKVGAQTIEFIAEPGFQGEGCAINGRAYSASSPASSDHPRKILVGGGFIAQTNPGNGNPGFDVFGLNVVGARTSGNPGENTVGIENDILLNSSVPDIAPGNSGAQNATAYWAQSGQPGIVANTGFLLTATGPAVEGGIESGWLYGLYSNCPIFNHLMFMRNTLNAPSARGARFETQWGDPSGRVLECFRGGDEQFRVDGGGVDPVWIRVGSQLRKLTVVARQNLQDNMFVVVAV